VRARGGVFRYLNIFRMGVGELSSQTHVHVQHGASTTIRDSRFDPPSDFSPGGRLCDTMQSTPEAAAHILESRSARFDEWITDAPGVITTSSGERRMYLPGGLAQLLTNTTACGDESGEWSQPAIIAKKPSVAKMGHTQELHEWQAVFAMTAMCVAFGETDSEGQPYMSLAALRSLYLQSELPSGWAPRPWGFFNGVRMVARLSEMPKCRRSQHTSTSQLLTGCQAERDRGARRLSHRLGNSSGDAHEKSLVGAGVLCWAT
jgi:hypothetical protein